VQPAAQQAAQLVAFLILSKRAALTTSELFRRIFSGGPLSAFFFRNSVVLKCFFFSVER
jgi:hypothetical protein